MKWVWMNFSGTDAHNTDPVHHLSLDHQAQNVMHTTMMCLGKESRAVKKSILAAKFVTSCYGSKLFHIVGVSDRKRDRFVC